MTQYSAGECQGAAFPLSFSQLVDVEAVYSVRVAVAWTYAKKRIATSNESEDEQFEVDGIDLMVITTYEDGLCLSVNNLELYFWSSLLVRVSFSVQEGTHADLPPDAPYARLGAKARLACT